MKFCKRYEEYMQGRRGKELPVVGLRKLKKILKRCRRDFQSQNQHGHEEGGSPHEGNRCLDRCPVCDRTFFPSLIKEMSAVVGYFNERAQKLLKLHLASGFRKYLMCFGCKSQRSRGALIQEGKDLLAYAIINSIAMRKILKKYDKVHYSKQGQAFRSQAQSMHIEILQSPWFCELMAFCINLRQSKVNSKAFRGLVDECLLICDDDKPMLSCGPLDSMKVEIDLTCSICLDIVFDPVSLTCGHIFCFMCCCSAGSVSIVDGLKAVGKKAKCPLCRQAGVYAHAVRLDELNILLRRSCRDYWVERLQSERVERLRRTKEHWQFQCQAFLGV